jgi:DNA-binding GntR family transcriptional regulator
MRGSTLTAKSASPSDDNRLSIIDQEIVKATKRSSDGPVGPVAQHKVLVALSDDEPSDLPVTTRAPSIQSTSVVVAETLRREILGGILPGGTRVLQDDVATRMGVSQTVVREAFKQLTTEGFLRAEPRRGVTVAPLTREDAEELVRLRSVVEVQALEFAIAQLRESDFSSARAVLDQLEAARTADEVIRLNALFHDILYSPSKRERTLALVAMLRLSFDRYFHFVCDESGQIPRSHKDHRQLLKLCEARDLEAASTLLRQHILRSAETLNKRLKATA